MKKNKQIIIGVNSLKKSDKKYKELHQLWEDVEPYLCNNRYAPIKKINKHFYNFIKRHKFNNDWDVWSICQNYITSKEYRPNLVIGNYTIVKYADAWGLKKRGSDRLIAIRNTQKELHDIIKHYQG